MENRILCLCGCTLKNSPRIKQTMRQHKKTEKHRIFLNSGNREIWYQIINLRGCITLCHNSMLKLEMGSDVWNALSIYLDELQEQLSQLENQYVYPLTVRPFILDISFD